MSEENVNSNPESTETTTEQSWLNPDGSFGDLSAAPDDVREFVNKKGFTDVPTAIKAHRELEGLLGQKDKLVRIPDEGDKEGWNNLYNKLGRPESPDKYNFEVPEGVDMQVDDGLLGMFKEYAHQRGMSQQLFEDTVKFQLEAAEQAELAYQEQQLNERNGAQKAIRERFSTEDEYNQYTQKALGFAEAFKLNDERSVADVIEAKGLAHDPEILDMLGSLADRTAEDSLQYDRTKSSEPTREERIKAIKSNPAFVNPEHPEHKKVVREFQALCLRREG